ncbi:hypothetical protein [Cumulibacter soli]|uniref:hypothetical protein n=1 Tax=Cumulibacter soli TaxID=2546344 RepID=UPI001067D15D|nr:hypothetical protein [Cumulibacter soli]
MDQPAKMYPDSSSASTSPTAPPERDLYVVRLSVARLSTPTALNVLFPLAAVGGAVAFLMTQGTATTQRLAAAVWLILCTVAFLAWRMPTRTISVGLGERSLTLSRDGDEHRIALPEIANVEISPLPYVGENLGNAECAFPLKGQHTLSVTDRAGKRYFCAIDLANPYGKRIVDSLRERSMPMTPWEAHRKDVREQAAKRLAMEHEAEQRTREPRASRDRDPQPHAETHASLWAQAIGEHDRVLLAYGAYETDPLLLLRFPGIVDVTIDETADFFHALGEAGALRLDEFPGAGSAFESYRGSVRTLTKAWAKAEKNARGMGISALSDPDQRRISQAAKLLRHAEGAQSQLERGAYLQQARNILDKLVESGAITPPPKMLFEIQRAAGVALEAGQSESS